MQHAVTGQAAFRSLGPMTDSPKRRLNRIARPNVNRQGQRQPLFADRERQGQRFGTLRLLATRIH